MKLFSFLRITILLIGVTLVVESQRAVLADPGGGGETDISTSGSNPCKKYPKLPQCQ